MRKLLLLPFLTVCAFASPVVTGPDTAVMGQQSVFSVAGATEPYTWFAVPPGESEANARQVNPNKPALATSWQGRPGKWHVWVQAANGRSNSAVINVLSTRDEHPQIVQDPNAVVPWSEVMQATPKPASAIALSETARAQPARRLVPDMPETPLSSTAVGMLSPQRSSPNVGDVIARQMEADEDGAPMILSPNADNVLDLAAQLIEPEVPGALRNPFVRSRALAAKPKEFRVHLSAVVLGPRTSIVLNDQVHMMNDSVDGTPLRVSEITRDYATLRTGRFMLRIPIDVPTTIRLPN